MQNDSKLLSGFPFIGHGNPDNNLESRCIRRLLRLAGLWWRYRNQHPRGVKKSLITWDVRLLLSEDEEQ
jgi:hypothetical protein